MEITLSELLEGKATVIKGKDYLSTKEYVQPFLDKMSKLTNDFRVHIKLPDQMTVDATSKDTTYNRVLVEAVLPNDHTIQEHDEVIGFLYGLDVRKPISKVYRGYLNRACTNLTVFSPKWMVVQEIKPNEEITFDAAKLMSSNAPFEDIIKKMKVDEVDRKTLHTRLGKWVDMCLQDSYNNGIQNVRMSPNTPIEAYKSLFIDDTSDYFVAADRQPNMFEIYNAFTQIITNDTKDFINKFEKTMMVNQLLEIK